MPHPFNDPLFDKADYARSMVGATSGAAFQMLLEEGGSHDDVLELASQCQGVIARAAKNVLVTHVGSIRTADPPPFNSHLGHPEQPPEPEAPKSPPNPFEDLP